jgi:hypothetical protein
MTSELHTRQPTQVLQSKSLVVGTYIPSLYILLNCVNNFFLLQQNATFKKYCDPLRLCQACTQLDSLHWFDS